MRKILFMHQVSDIGGGSYCLLNILKNIDRSEFDPIVLLKSQGPLSCELEKLNVKVYYFSAMKAIPYNRSLLSRGSLRSYIKVISSVPKFLKFLMQLNVDILYLNNMMLYHYLKPAKELGLKTVIHVREHWPEDEHLIQLSLARKFVYKYADKIIAINRYSSKIFPEKESTIVYDWIDMDSRFREFHLSDYFGNNVGDLKIYLYTGGLQSIKGASEVLDAFTNIIHDANARLLVIGIDPSLNLIGIKGTIKNILSKIGLNCYEISVKKQIASDSRIICIPATYYLSHIIQQAYCNLSYFTIPHANLTLAECEILGTPSVAACTDESLEYSLNGELSILYKINDKKDFYRAIKNLDENYGKLKSSLSDKANIVKSMFSPESNIAKLNSVLKLL